MTGAALEKCWICGAAADSREHRIKASDVRRAFRSPTQENPIFSHHGEELNRPIGSARSRNLTYTNRICGDCNGRRSQPYDKAWESLSTYLAQHPQLAVPGKVVALHKVFPGKVRRSMTEVQLFFVKHFGFKSLEDRIALPLDTFAASLRTGTAHPDIHLALTPTLHVPRGKRMAYNSEVVADSADGRVSFAVWFYAASEAFGMKVMYWAPGSRRRLGLRGSWHPSSVTKLLTVADLSDGRSIRL